MIQNISPPWCNAVAWVTGWVWCRLPGLRAAAAAAEAAAAESVGHQGDLLQGEGDPPLSQSVQHRAGGAREGVGRGGEAGDRLHGIGEDTLSTRTVHTKSTLTTHATQHTRASRMRSSLRFSGIIKIVADLLLANSKPSHNVS